MVWIFAISLAISLHINTKDREKKKTLFSALTSAHKHNSSQSTDNVHSEKLSLQFWEPV